MTPDDLRDAMPVIAQRCEEVGRDPQTLAVSVHVWRKDEERNRREPLGELIAAYRELGVARVMALLPGIEASDEPLLEYAALAGVPATLFRTSRARRRLRALGPRAARNQRAHRLVAGRWWRAASRAR